MKTDKSKRCFYWGCTDPVTTVTGVPPLAQWFCDNHQPPKGGVLALEHKARLHHLCATCAPKPCDAMDEAMRELATLRAEVARLEAYAATAHGEEAWQSLKAKWEQAEQRAATAEAGYKAALGRLADWGREIGTITAVQGGQKLRAAEVRCAELSERVPVDEHRIVVEQRDSAEAALASEQSLRAVIETKALEKVRKLEAELAMAKEALEEIRDYGWPESGGDNFHSERAKVALAALSPPAAGYAADPFDDADYVNAPSGRLIKATPVRIPARAAEPDAFARHQTAEAVREFMAGSAAECSTACKRDARGRCRDHRTDLTDEELLGSAAERAKGCIGECSGYTHAPTCPNRAANESEPKYADGHKCDDCMGIDLGYGPCRNAQPTPPPKPDACRLTHARDLGHLAPELRAAWPFPICECDSPPKPEDQECKCPYHLGPHLNEGKK